MIYDISKHSIESILSDERLVSELMRKTPIMTESETKEKIKFAYERCEGFKRPLSIKSNDHQPCQDCGGIDFIRTGTCFVCQTCASSQGCS
jgi:hypothetical protein